ncbi:hypothetical protein K432DRAFT_386822 [Lepidopterella palustris CBS 459.81]|uniref:P-loop containing nucleoside triphosphate hydrolase protein n=1 Tax=Lepidopterella palustris CBS 459.81 TaxID=1314670 RepID=A0A8E2J9L8_9PEZI|nr:hypothetical protein K432DRAFT_386822 [Lepidopterella palustris CBS 459.81]
MDLLKDIVYPLDPPSRTRTQPMQVLAVGPSRSGTDSLRAALITLGYSHTYHGWDIAMHAPDDRGWHDLLQMKRRGLVITAADFDRVIGHCVAITDIPAALFAADLIAAYPDAKVILNVRRDVDAWFASCMATVVAMQRDSHLWLRSWFCTELFWVEAHYLRGVLPFFYRGKFQYTAKWVLREHCAMVRGLVSKDKLLKWNVGDGWGPLCEFLGKDVPDKDFPRGNGTKEHALTLEKLHQSYNARADRNMAITSGVVILLVLFAYTLLV